MISVGSDFSGVGAFDQALIRLGIKYNTVFACDMDKYARQTYIHNYGGPDYFPMDVYDREIPTDPLDIYMTSPPCQAFSLAGKRKGEDDKRGILFYNSHEFIKKNNPRYFIFENVKGLLSDDSGKTFRRWVEYLGGKSINGNPVLFPHSESVPYHIYWKVLNAKNYGIPQNRERVFIIGIRSDDDNNFTWPKKMFLEKRLRDVLEKEVDYKYYLSDGAIQYMRKPATGGYSDRMSFVNHSDDITAGTITANHSKGIPYNVLFDNINNSGTMTKYGNSQDSINFEQPNSETRRGRVGKRVANTLDTGCNQGMISVIGNIYESGHNAGDIFDTEGIIGTLTCSGVRPSLKNVAPKILSTNLSGQVFENDYCGTLRANASSNYQLVKTPYRIRRLTPRECFRLMDFPDTFTWPVSDTQAYKQAGNSICVGVLASIIGRLKL